MVSFSIVQLPPMIIFIRAPVTRLRINTCDFFQIPVVANLPVGVNVKDHIALFVPQITISQPVSMTGEQIMSLANEFKYKMWKTGLWKSG
jgi:hypothetical protein